MRGKKPPQPGLHRLPNSRRPRHRPEVEHPELAPEPPAALTEAAKAEWAALVAVVPRGHLAGADSGLVMMYATLVARWKHIEAALAAEPNLVVPSAKGRQTVHTLVGLSHRTIPLIVAVASALGFTPTSRPRVSVITPPPGRPIPEGGPPEDEFTAFQRQRRRQRLGK